LLSVRNRLRGVFTLFQLGGAVKILGFFDGGVVVDERGRFGCGDTAGTDVDEERVLLISAGVGGFAERLITCEWNSRIGASSLERAVLVVWETRENQNWEVNQ
jgi:hypothetical protein